MAAIAGAPRSATVRRLCLRGAAVAIASVAAVCGAFTPSASASTLDGFFGVNPGDLFNLPQPEWDRHLDAMSADGIQVVRVGAWWSDLEPAPPVAGQHTYYWSELDQRVAALARHGLRWQPLLCFSPLWGAKVPGDYTAAPSSADDFAGFAAALARRYGRGGSFWGEHPDLPSLPVTTYELWNEQNALLYWHPGENAPEEYADLYAAAHTSIHQADDGARVLVGGLASTAVGVVPAGRFLQRMIAHRPDVRGNLDAVALHPYARDPGGVYATLAAFRRALDTAAGPGIPIELTEIGWTTSDTSERQRAVYLETLATTLPRSDCGVERLMPYAWIGAEQAGDDREQWFGIRNRDASSTPSSTAYANAIRRVRGTSGPPLAGAVKVCGSSDASDAPAATNGSGAMTGFGTTRRGRAPHSLKLTLRVKQNSRRRNRLQMVAGCSARCRIRVVVLAVPGSAAASRNRRVAKHSSRLATRRHALSLSLPMRRARSGTRVRVTVVAVDRLDRRMKRHANVRLR